MKWYFAINEAGTQSDIGWHAKLAVLSAWAVGGLSPHMLYDGPSNPFTDWVRAHGVTVLPHTPRFLPEIARAEHEGRYHRNFTGHWLRAGVCEIEHEDEFVLYTDCDVIFRRRPDLDAIRPARIACAPEFRPDAWSSFNSGVMVMNVPALRSDQPAFARFVTDRMAQPDARGFDDQVAYNEFYAGYWDRLDPLFNWKAYWRLHPGAAITHWHGPKFNAIRRILDGAQPWDEPHDRQIGSMFILNMPFYIAHLHDTLALLGDFDERPVIERLLQDAERLWSITRFDRLDFGILATTRCSA